MNGYNILVIILACVVLGVSIWAFVTRCNTDKFGYNNTAYENFLNQRFQSIKLNGEFQEWGFDNKLNIQFFQLKTANSELPFDTKTIPLKEAINPFLPCENESLGCYFNPDFISKDNFNNLINKINSQSPDNNELTRPTDYTINNPEWQNVRRIHYKINPI